ncbi:Localization factor PodJS [Caulobacter flavus]|uniref:Localization factor PodJS n=1 Tax=Caulobacter flavus TaxID=1679497 RepID=A0A2N5CT53_9CAUL|nr:SEL1-like repeat protein [Caulobacter flavus]AYV49189.1 Localization factor PodJS [Caulobacter flavus]PLR14835.1 Localization factor PodJS [Caulobacter flavus]
MTAAAPWSVKGIDPKAREVAKDLARRSGMTLGEWLNRMIIEGDSAGFDAPPADPVNDTGRSNGRSVYLEAERAEAPPRIEAPEHPADEVGRMATALDRLTQRIEAAEARSAQAITGIDQSVRGALQRLSHSEREQIAVAARFEGLADEIKTEQTRNAERLRRIENEAAGPRSAEALRALESAVGRVANHLYEGESRTRETLAALEAKVAARDAAPAAGLVDEVVARLQERLEAAEARTAEALQQLGGSFQALDTRLSAVEGEGGSAQKRLEELAGSLSAKMEAARVEMAAKLRETADGRFDRMERKLGEMTAHIQAAEQRSAQAIERMGREVVGLADAFNRRIQTSEARQANAIEQVGGEVARIASSVEHKLNRADSVQAQALEKLGVEIARITEKLAERISASERRNALAIDDVGDQVVRVTDRLNQRAERSSQELIDRIRQSEERTARLLDEAREKIDTRLADAQRRLAETPAPAPVRPAAPAPSPFETDRFSFGGETVSEDVFEQPAFPQPSFQAPAASPVAVSAPVPAATVDTGWSASSGFDADFPVEEPQAPGFADEDFEAADGFTATPRIEAPSFEADAFDPEPELPPAPARALSTREVIEQARAAARAAAAGAETKAKAKTKADKAAAKSLFAGFGKALQKKDKRTSSSTLVTALLVSAGAAALGVGTAGLTLLPKDSDGPLNDRVARAIAGRATDIEIKTREADTTPAQPRVSMAVVTPAASTGAASAEPEAPAPAAVDEGSALFAEAVSRLEAKDRGGLAPLRKAANLGQPKAQFLLAKMAEMGEGGVRKDLAEARRWYERAAQGGDPSAMHNIALFAYRGDGGDKNLTTAANWFRKAAETGLVDSQFNLAQLYENGRGVAQNPAEAYRWYLIAARAGDADARARASALRGQLTPESQRIAERSAEAFRSRLAAAPRTTQVATAAAPSAGTATAQRALSSLGYYQGPKDGVSSPALRMAVQAYQRDQNLPASGALDGETLNRLSAFAR